MKTKHLFWGFLFITIGVLTLINNFSSIDLYWLNLWQFWPLFLILAGISLLIKQETIKAIVLIITAVILGVMIFSTFKLGWGFFRDEIVIDTSNGFKITDSDDKKLEIKSFDEEYNGEIKNASLNFKGGAGFFKISDTTSNLFSAIAKGYSNKYELTRYDEGENTRLHFENEKEGFSIFKGKNRNQVHISLNTLPVWKINVDMGAAESEFNLSSYKVEYLDVDIGAASLKITLGDLLDSAKVDVDAGASSVEIYIPENAGCEINADIILSSRKLEGFRKIKDDVYRTENFDSSAKKIYMNIDTGVSSVKVKRYTTDESW